MHTFDLSARISACTLSCALEYSRNNSDIFTQKKVFTASVSVECLFMCMKKGNAENGIGLRRDSGRKIE